MSIGKVDSYSDMKKRLLTVGGVGAAAGVACSASKKRWLYNNGPTDAFVRRVSENLENSLPSKERQEASIIKSFLKSAVDTQVDLKTLKPQIRASKELSEAIKLHPDENINTAIERVFSNPDKDSLRAELIGLQKKTVSDKKYGNSAALRLIHENFDAKNSVLKQSNHTSDEVFKMIKSTARELQIKSAVVGGIVAGAVLAGLTLVTTEVSPKKQA